MVTKAMKVMLICLKRLHQIPTSNYTLDKGGTRRYLAVYVTYIYCDSVQKRSELVLPYLKNNSIVHACNKFSPKFIFL